jgi:anti-sigma-K factor RskA
MTDPTFHEQQQLASEYVLGILSAERRRQVEEALPHDTALRTAVREWEERLLPLTNLVDPVTPSSQLWSRIERTVSAKPAPSSAAAHDGGTIGNWWNRLGLWRTLAAGGFAAASIMAVMVSTRLQPVAAPRYMVVLAEPQNMAPGWVMQMNDAGTLRLIPLGRTDVPEQKSLQLWTKGEGWKGPVSLGLVTPGEPLDVPLDKLPPLQPNQLFEITLEPHKGSPIDRPTGPILYIGRAVKMI